MREILFRGKRKDNGEWVEGVPIKNKLGTFICYEENPHYCSQYYYMEIQDIVEVIPETVGQYTGLTDKNGKSIFEHDIIMYPHSGFTVLWQGEIAGFMPFYEPCFKAIGGDGEVVGNIFDNPELTP